MVLTPKSGSPSSQHHMALTPTRSNATANEDPSLCHHPERTFRPVPFLHPTHIDFTPHSAENGTPASHWSSRASRKGRYASRSLRVAHKGELHAQVHGAEVGTPAKKREALVVHQRIRHPYTRLKVHLTRDVSFWVAVVFVVGSMLWVINGFILFLPLLPSPSPPHTTAAAWTAFAGGTFFEIGSYLMIVEAINAGHEQLFGPALWALVEDVEAGKNVNESEGTEGERNEKHVKFRWM